MSCTLLPGEPNQERVFEWEQYNARTRDREPEQTLLRALRSFEKSTRAAPLKAVDLGAGGGRDTRELLKRNWDVLAIDVTPRSLQEITASAKAFPGRLQTMVASFQSMKLQANTADLVNASYSLPFVPKNQFPAVWKKITAVMKDGGIFAGQFFGVQDEWNNNKDMTFFDIDEVKKLLEGFEVGYLAEVHSIEPGGGAPRKHWHYFNVVTRKLKELPHGNS